MVTGDNVETAKSIAEKCGIIPKGNKGLLVLDGPTFRKKVMTVTEDGREVVSYNVHVHYQFTTYIHTYVYTDLIDIHYTIPHLHQNLFSY